MDDYDQFANEFGVSDMLGNVMEWTQDTQYPPFKTRKKIKFNIAKGGAWNATDTLTISSRGLYKNDFTSSTPSVSGAFRNCSNESQRKPNGPVCHPLPGLTSP